MKRFLRKLTGALRDPLRAVRILWNESVHKTFVRISYAGRTTCTFEVAGTQVVFDTADGYSKEWFFPRCDRGQYHEPAVTNLLSILAPSAPSFLDVGAHLGYFTVLAGALMKGKSVLAYEMDDRAYERLVRNVSRNKLDNVQLFHGAISGKTGPVQYRHLPMLDSGESLSFAGSDDPSKTVPGSSVDDVFRDTKVSPGLIKIDVEGADYDVLSGMPNTLKAHATLLLEIHGRKLPLFGSDSQAVITLLTNAGYEVYEILDHRSTAAPELARLFATDPPFERNTMTLAVHSSDVVRIQNFLTRQG